VAEGPRWPLPDGEPQFELATGISAATALGKTDQQLFGRAPAELGSAYDGTATRSAVEFEDEAALRGGPIYLATEFPLLRPDGKPRALCRIASDISGAGELVAAIRRVLSGGRAGGPPAELAAAGIAPDEMLSRRELEVLRHIANGLAIKKIAETLAISTSTVHTHRAHIVEKLNLRSDVELSRYAVRHGLIE